MGIEAGQQLLHYRLTERIGAGGMGVVWRAMDTTLDRAVAIKILPDSLAEDPERLARFAREAKLLASLNHPNIAAVYGLHHAPGSEPPPGAGGINFLAMELVDGEDLSAVLKGGPLPVEQVLSCAKQIADALEEAHEKGVVHRDLKPANLRLTPEGKLKVLDFGLAKAFVADAETGAADLSLSPTITTAGTRAGVILGTAAYMAPEQAKGFAVDKRADIWAFGVVLFEMLTGRQLFGGDSASDTLAGVLKDEIDFSRLPASTPPAIHRLLRQCLQRDPRNRLHDIADARIVIDEQLAGKIEESSSPAATGGRRIPAARPATLVASVVLLLALGAVGGWLARRPAPAGALFPTRLSIRLMPESPYKVSSIPGCSIAISRDGARVAYVAAFESREQLVVRALDEIVPRAITTEDVVRQPFFSPDGKWIGYFGRDSLQKISLEGGRPVTIVAELSNAAWVRGSWSDDGRIVYDTWNTGLRVVSADGGQVRVLTEPEEEWHLGPEVIPGTATVLFFTQSAASFSIEAIDLDGSGRRTVLDDASQPHFLSSGHLLFQRNGGLFVAPFDAKNARVTGPAMPLALEAMVDDERAATPVPQLAVATAGTLVYAPKASSARAGSELIWVDRQGKSALLANVPFPDPSFDLSPDGGQMTLAVRDGSRARLALFDIPRQTLTPLRDERLDIPTAAVYSADGQEVYFARYGTHRGEILAQRLEGGEPRLLGRLEATWIAPYSISRDGHWLVGTLYDPKSQSDIWLLDLTAGDPGGSTRVLATKGEQVAPALSPDGRWLAYGTDEAGEFEIYLQRFPGGESKVRVTSGGGEMARWSPDGRELYFLSGNGAAVMAVAVKTEPKLELGAPFKLFDGSFQTDTGTGPAFELSADGRKFALIKQIENPKRSEELIVVQNWLTELGKLFEPGSR